MSSLVIPVTGGVGPIIIGGVGSHIERVIDPLTGVVLWDLNDPTGSNNPLGLQTRIRSFDLGTVERRQEFLEPDSPIDQLVYGREGRARAEWVIRCSAASYDNLRLSLGELHRLLSNNQVIQHQPDGQAEPLYLDTLPAPQITPLLRGQGLDLERLVLRKFEDIEYRVVVWRQGSLRSPELDPPVNKATNPFHLVDIGGDGRPDGWEWSSTTGLSSESIDASAETYKFTRASAATVDFREAAANADTAAPGDVWTGQVKARASSGSTARARAIVQFLSAANAVLQTDLGVLTALGTAEVTLTVTSAAAPATTAKVRVGIRFENSDAAANICHTRDPQAEKASAPSTHRAGEQTAALNPGTALSGMLLKNRGSAPTPYVITAKMPDASSKVSELLLAMRSSEGIDGHKRIADLVNETGWACLAGSERGWTVVHENNTSSDSDSANGAIGGLGTNDGDAAQIDGASANVGVMLRRVRLTRTTKLDSLRGWSYVWLRLRAAGIGASPAGKWEVQLRWSPSLANPATKTRTAVIHDALLASTFGYVEIPLGFIDLPEDPTVALAGVALEIWARRVSPSTGDINFDPDLYLDLVRLLPATPGKDVLTRIQVPYSLADQWLGSELLTPTSPGGLLAGTVSGDGIVLNAINEAAGAPPNAGIAWGVGRHRVSFDFTTTLPNNFNGGPHHVRVRNLTDNNDAVRYRGLHPVGRSTVEVEFDGVAGKLYQPQLVLTAGGDTWTVHSVKREVLPYVTQNEQIRADPLWGVIEKLNAAGEVVTQLKQQGPTPLWVPPGTAAVFVVPFDVRRAGYNELESMKGRTLMFSAKGAPRRYL